VGNGEGGEGGEGSGEGNHQICDNNLKDNNEPLSTST